MFFGFDWSLCKFIDENWKGHDDVVELRTAPFPITYMLTGSFIRSTPHVVSDPLCGTWDERGHTTQIHGQRLSRLLYRFSTPRWLATLRRSRRRKSSSPTGAKVVSLFASFHPLTHVTVQRGETERD